MPTFTTKMYNNPDFSFCYFFFLKEIISSPEIESRHVDMQCGGHASVTDGA